MGASFKMRVITSIVGIPILILVLLSPVPVILGLVIIASLVALYEYYKAVGLLEHTELCIVGYISSIVLSFGANFSVPTSLVLVYVFITAIFVIMLLSNHHITIVHISMLVFGLIYIPFFLSHIVYIRTMDYGNFFVWLVFVGAFITDSSAYFVGRIFGRHKLCPTISPKKTVEGAIGGVLGGGLSFVIFGLIVNIFFGGFLGGKNMSLLMLFLLGIITAVVSQIGDLVASAIKRQFGIKDYGNIIPGHGGILDRCDSIIMVAPIIFLFLYNINILV